MPTLEELVEFLPQTDCGQCGLSCREFAAFLQRFDLSPEDCPVLHEPEYAGYIEALHELLGEPETAPTTGMRIDPDKCLGCGICVTLCEYHLGNCADVRSGRGPQHPEQVIFRVVNGAVVVVHQERCTRLVQAAEKCSKCAEHCPTGAITLY